MREINEDSVFAGELPATDQPSMPGRHLLMVADGVGGLERGEWASEKAVAVVTRELPLHLASHEPSDALRLSIQAANQQICLESDAASNSRSGPAATTIVAAVVDDTHVWWANVGDSRAYLVGSERVERLTRDHSWVEEQVRTGSLTPEEARRSLRRNVITRGVGFLPEVEVDTGGPVAIKPGDVIVLCSDGVHALLTDVDIAEVVRALPPEQATARLIALSNERGGTDNISVIVCRFLTNEYK